MKGRRLTCSSILVVVAIIMFVVLFSDNSDPVPTTDEQVVLDTASEDIASSDESAQDTADEAVSDDQPQVSRGDIIADSGFDLNRDGFRLKIMAMKSSR